MASNDDFIHISTGPGPNSNGWKVSGDFFRRAQASTPWYTEGSVIDSIRNHHRNHHLTVNNAFQCDLLAYADARDDASYSPINNRGDGLVERQFLTPMRRYNDENGGKFGERVVFGTFEYKFQGNEFLLYVVEGHDGMYSKTRMNYILVAPSEKNKEMSELEKEDAQKKTDELLAAGSRWMQELHGEVLVFDQGYWQKNKELYENIQKAEWEDVILEKEKKESIIDDVLGFFDAEDRYAEFGVPWKVSTPSPMYPSHH